MSKCCAGSTSYGGTFADRQRIAFITVSRPAVAPSPGWRMDIEVSLSL
ncbi:hypothetical protein AB0I77_50985 [Streptomyces sp. NPDC050619]